MNGTVIVQAHQWGGELGRLDLLFVKDQAGTWQVDRYRARLIPITPDIPEDPGVAAVVDQFWKPIAAQFGEVVGQAAGEFASRGDDLAEYNLVADALRESFNAEFAMENMGGVRAPLIRGAITEADLVTLDPFNNTVVTFKATGKQIRDILQRYSPAVSGIRYRLENKRTGGRHHRRAAARRRPRVQRRDELVLRRRRPQGTDDAPGHREGAPGRPRRTTSGQKGTVRPAYDGRRIVSSNR